MRAACSGGVPGLDRFNHLDAAEFAGGEFGESLGVLNAERVHLQVEFDDFALTFGEAGHGIEAGGDRAEGDQRERDPCSEVEVCEHDRSIGPTRERLNRGMETGEGLRATEGHIRGYTWPVNSWRINMWRAALQVVVVCLLSLAPIGPVQAQQGGTQGGAAAGGSGESEADAPSAQPAAVGTGEVRLRVMALGVGGKVRSGDWAGIQVDVTDNGPKVRDVLVRLSMPDADGDTTWVQRAITTNPAQRQSMWLYLRVPSDFNSSTLSLSAFEAIASGEGATRTYRAGKLLGSTVYPVNADVSYTRSFIGVIGSSSAGADQYMWPAVKNPQYPPTGHEHTELANGLAISNLPDKWFGLSAFEVLLWTGNDPVQHQPSQMKSGQPDALREWVQRGGHLVIVLPPVGQNWYDTGGGASGASEGGSLLADILPRVKVKRREGVSMEAYRSLLTRDRRAALPENMVVHEFEPAEAGAFEAMPVMQGAGGETVVVRRLVGAGAVTVIGLDVASQKLRDPAACLQADHFWHRIIGKRLALPTPADLDQAMKGGPKGANTREWVIDRRDLVMDASIARTIAKSGSAAAGVLLGLVVFAAYWVVAGPLGFFGLRHRGQVQHSWMWFVGAIALFTGIAWGGANLLKTRRVEGQHLTIVDGVYGQPMQRARSFVSLFLPRYGEQRVSIASGDERVLNAVSPWEPPQVAGGAGFSAFPDARGYAYNARMPDTMVVPSRATVKQMQLDWSGGLPATWGMPVPAGGMSVSVGGEIRLVPREPPISMATDRPIAGAARRWAVEGTISHNLPGTLNDVYVVLVRGPLPTSALRGGLQCDAHIVTVREWAPVVPQPIDAWFDQQSLASMQAESALKDLLGRPGGFGGMVGDDVTTDVNKRLIAVSLFNMLKPPDPVEQTTVYRAERQSMHGYDLSRWLTQPCLIVMGFLEDSELPVPLRVDDLASESVCPKVRGKTLVRWVFPITSAGPDGVLKADPSRTRLTGGPDQALPAEPSRLPAEPPADPGQNTLPGE